DPSKAMLAESRAWGDRAGWTSVQSRHVQNQVSESSPVTASPPNITTTPRVASSAKPGKFAGRRDGGRSPFGPGRPVPRPGVGEGRAVLQTAEQDRLTDGRIQDRPSVLPIRWT